MTDLPPRPKLDPAIQIRPGTDLDDVWDRFEVFEALHHSMQVCNPLRSDQLDDVIAALQLTPGDLMLDVACGYGETLIRAATASQIVGVGVDLSPWMIAGAVAAAHGRVPHADLTWVLGEASGYRPEQLPNAVACIGAEWVWHDFGGTARALAGLLGAGGVAVIGAARLHAAADPDRVRRTHGVVETIDDQRALLHRYGFEPLHRIDPDDAGWDAYLARTADAVGAWAHLHPGPRSDRWIAEQADWQAARERDRHVIGWSVWIARNANLTE